MEAKRKIEEKYINFLDIFVDDLDETKKCKWMFKNKNNKNNTCTILGGNQ